MASWDQDPDVEAPAPGAPWDADPEVEEPGRQAAAETSPGQAAVIGFSAGIGAPERGIGQLASEFLGKGEYARETARDVKAMRLLREEHPVATLTGEVAGSILDPLGWYIPGAKARSILGMAKGGAAAGGIAGALGPTEELGAAGLSQRFANAGMGVAVGGLGAGILGGLLNIGRIVRGKTPLPLVAPRGTVAPSVERAVAEAGQEAGRVEEGGLPIVTPQPRGGEEAEGLVESLTARGTAAETAPKLIADIEKFKARGGEEEAESLIGSLQGEKPRQFPSETRLREEFAERAGPYPSIGEPQGLAPEVPPGGGYGRPEEEIPLPGLFEFAPDSGKVHPLKGTTPVVKHRGPSGELQEPSLPTLRSVAARRFDEGRPVDIFSPSRSEKNPFPFHFTEPQVLESVAVPETMAQKVLLPPGERPILESARIKLYAGEALTPKEALAVRKAAAEAAGPRIELDHDALASPGNRALAYEAVEASAMAHIGNGSLRGGLGEIAKLSRVADPEMAFQGHLAQTLLDNPRIAPKVVRFDEGIMQRGAAAAYDNATGEMLFSPRAGLTQVLHETAHLAGNRALLTRMAGEAGDLSPVEVRAADGLLDQHRWFRGDPKAQLAAEQAMVEHGRWQGAGDPYAYAQKALATLNAKPTEFFAYGWATPSLQKALRALPYEGQTFWSRLGQRWRELVGLEPRFQSQFDRFMGHAEPLVGASSGQAPGRGLASRAYATSSELGTRGPKGNEAGFISPQLAAQLGSAVGGGLIGAAANPEDPLVGGLTGMAVGFGLARFGTKVLSRMAPIPGVSPEAARGWALRGFTDSRAVQAADKILGIVSARIGNMSPAILRQLRNHELRITTGIHEAMVKTDPFVAAWKDLRPREQQALRKLLINNDADGVRELAAGLPALRKALAGVDEVLNGFGQRLEAAGRIDEMRPGYFPRVVKDRDGLLRALGSEEQSRVSLALAEAIRKNGGEALTPVRETQVINQALRGYMPGEFRPGLTKAREFQGAVPEQFQQFYADPVESLHSYIREATTDLERLRLFGRDAGADLGDSIGAYVGKALKRGELKETQVRELEDILRSRFVAGERGAAPLLQDVKNIIYAGLLGNPIAAGVQLGDLFTSVALHGLKPTLGGIVKSVTGKGVRLEDFGLMDRISEEFVNQRQSTRLLNAMLRYSGFEAADRLGKQTLINATFTRFSKLSRSEAGQARIAQKYGRYFGDDLPQVMDDLGNRRLTGLTKELLFSELSDVQPISRLEVPQKYLDMPNGRIMYMLHSFQLKQMDLMRTQGLNQIKEGRVAQGLAALGKLGLAMGIAGATTSWTRDYLMGRPVDPSVTDIPMNLFKTFGWSDYTAQRLSQGKVGSVVIGSIAPPYQMFDRIYRMETDPATGEKHYALNPEGLQYVPIVGRVLENWFGGGLERAQERYTKKQRVEALAEYEAQYGALAAKKMLRQYYRAPSFPELEAQKAKRRHARPGARGF